MRKFSRAMILGASLTAVVPLAANAATHSLFTPSAKLVQQINNTYGTSFKVPASHASVAAQHQVRTQRTS